MYIEEFTAYLSKEKRMAENSVDAYRRDILEFSAFEESRGNADITQASSTEVVAYLHHLKAEEKSPSTVNRKLASIRAFYNWLMTRGAVRSNPTAGIRSPKIERKEIEYLSMEEIDALLEGPDDSPKGIRDRAMLEILYATGIRATELIDINADDINFRMGFLSCLGESSKTRIVPLGRPARVALENYYYDVRPILLKDNKDEEALFVNYAGRRITRQGLWKVLKEYGAKAGIEHKLTPNILRNSFAVHMLQNGADLKTMQELMGHEDISATQMYLSATKNKIKEVYDNAHPRAK